MAKTEDAPSRKRKFTYGIQGTLPAWVVLTVSLLGTALAWYLTHTAVIREASLRFDSEIGAVRADLADRLRAYEQILRGGVSLHHTLQTVTRENWRDYVENLEISESYPGLQGIGFSQVIAPGDVDAHVLAVRAEGFPEYSVWPDGEREIYTSIVYLEPFDWRNQRAFGYDMFQEPVRRLAMERARDTGLASLSGRVSLVQETNEAVQAGFLIFLPVYRTPTPSDALERRRQLVGYVYSPFRMNDFMRGFMGDRGRSVALEIFDGSTVSEDGIMYDSTAPGRPDVVDEPSSTVEAIDLNGHTWTLRFSALPALAADRSKPVIVLAGGLVVSFLLWGIVASLARQRTQAAAANERLRLDIVERERVEAQLRDTETSFRYLFDKNPNPMWVYERENLAILEVNDAAVAHYGYSHEEFRKMRITDLRPSEDVPRLMSHIATLPDGLRRPGEWRHITKDGRIIDVDIASYHLEFKQRPAALVVARDTTESKRAREALAASEAAARGVLETALDAYIRMNDQGLITAWNTMAEKTFGWTQSEAINQKLENLIIPHDQRAAHRSGLKRYLASGEGPMLNRRTEVQALHRSGRTLPVEITILPVETESGRDFSAFLRDLTDIKRAEAQLLQAQKMEAVGLLTGGVAHDFNNLLTVVIGNLELATASGSTDSPNDEIIADALAAAEKGAALTHRLLAFSRQQPLHPVHADLNAIVAGMIEMLRRTLGEDIEIDVKLDKDLWPELADKSQVENALLNLAINARDAMPKGGKLTIETLNTSLDEAYAARNADVQPGDYVMLAITDTGAGMPPEVIERVFEPFFTTKADRMGSGLGLSMIYGFARQSGGHVMVYSEVGHGTTVRLYLPRATSSDEDEPLTQDDDRTPEGPGGNEAILVVEDDASVRKLVVANLEQMGYRVLEAADGAAALKLLRNGANIDLLFTDVILPGGMNGRELADECRSLRPGLRVLFTSGYTRNSIVHQGKLDEGVHLLSKPYRRDELSRKVRQVLGFHDQDA
ncbi:MAG: CHASE domain-containing protein [Woeseia sp.]